MPKKAVLHVPPLNSSAHQSLISEIRNAEFDPEILRNVLWLINAHNRLIAFPRVCRNLVNIIEEAKKSWGIGYVPLKLEEAIPLLRWVSDHEANLTGIGEDFNRMPRKDRDHPVMNRGSSRHPLYTTLWNTCEANELSSKYLLLQSHLLFSHAIQVELRTTRGSYEGYGGQDEWKALPNSPYGACLAVRELSEARHAGILRQLRVELPMNEFSIALANLPETRNADLTKRLEKLRNLLQKASGTRKWISRSIGGENSGKGGSKQVTGYVEITPSTFMQDLPIGDPADPDLDWGTQTLVSDIKLTPNEQKELLEYDLSPEEFDSEQILLSGYDSPLTGTLAANAGAQLRHVTMANQQLPWSYGQLTISDFGPNWTKTAAWVKSQFLDKPPPDSDSEWDKLEAFTLLRIMLFTGSSFERARNILDFSKSNPNEDAELAFIQLTEQSHAFRVRAIQPVYKTDVATSAETERVRTDYIYLPDISRTHMLVNLLRGKNSDEAKKNEFRLFRKRPDKLKNNLDQLLKELEPTGRLTLHKVSRFLYQRVLQVSGNDICAASLICGELHPLARVRLFYSVLSVERLQEIYIRATKELADQLIATGNSGDKAPPPNIYSQPHSVGSRLCPTFDAVKGAIATLKSDFTSATDPVEKHNLYTLLAVWHFSFAVACRAIETPYLPLYAIDQQSGIGIMADKDDGTGYKARLIWIPPSVLVLMNTYELYRSGLPQAQGMAEPVFFLLPGRDGNIQETAVRPKTLVGLMIKYLNYPANFHRRFMRTELLARGCPMEVVDAWMGHWYMGEEPWGPYSSFSFRSYRDMLEIHIKPLLDELGLDGLTPAPQPTVITV